MHAVHQCRKIGKKIQKGVKMKIENLTDHKHYFAKKI